MIIINSPHNPSGAILRDANLRKLESLATQHNLLVVSDEVYEHLVFDGEEHCSVLKYPGLRERSFATFSFGKTWPPWSPARSWRYYRRCLLLAFR